jgi:hypothetical protein
VNGQLPNSAGLGGTGGGGGGGGGYLAAEPQANDIPPGHGPASTTVLAVLAVIELVAVLVLPPVVYLFGTRRRKAT